MNFDTDFFVGLVIGGAVGALVVAVFLRARVAARLRRHAIRRHRYGQDGDGSVVAARVAEAGSLTSGLAHEIKNPLSSIVLNSQLLRESILDAKLPQDESHPLLRRVDSLTRETSRLKDILEEFLRYAGRIHLDRSPCDLRELVEDLTDFVHPECERVGVLVRADLPERAIPASIDAGLVKQALLNLMLNAAQAMESNEPGRRRELIVRVEAGDAEAGAAPTPRIHVIDTGPGIPDHLREEIFRPYVTTKKGGSGLGLAVAKRIVEEHGGSISVFTKTGTGSDFLVTLPSGAAVPEVSRSSLSP